MAAKILIYPGRALENGAKVGVAAVFRVSKPTLFTIAGFMKFFETERAFYFRKIVPKQLCFCKITFHIKFNTYYYVMFINTFRAHINTIYIK